MRIHKTSLLIGLLAVCGLTAPVAFADTIEYAITVDTSSQASNYGYIELQFNPSTSPTQQADADVLNFATDGSLDVFGSDPNDGTVGDVSGTLPGTVSFDNGVDNGGNTTSSFNDYFQGITFGDTITFDLLLSGPAIGSTANGDGGGTFTLDFMDSTASNYLFTDSSSDVPAFQANINADGSVTPIAYGSVGTAEAPGSVVTFASATVVPEPNTAVPLAAALLIGAFFFRKRRRTA